MGLFPDPRGLPDGESLACVGGDLEVGTLLDAYRCGIFPWPMKNMPLLWHCPDPRGILLFEELHVPRSLRRSRNKARYEFSFDKAFGEVIRACAEASREGQEGTWILPQMIEAYERLHRAGHAHSVECWRGERLVGGLYGVYVGGVFSGESMFHAEPDTSKLCLLRLVEALAERGLTWIDIQMVTGASELMGGRSVPREEFLDRLEESRRSRLPGRLLLKTPARPKDA